MKEVLAENRLPIFTSDGLKTYFYALTAHFGYWCPQEGRRKRAWIVATGFLYGQVVKRYRRRRTVGIEYRMQWSRFEDLKARLKVLGLSGKLNTAYVERANLTLRQGIAPLIRRTWGTAQTLDGLRLHFEWWRGYYHFIRPHMSLRDELSQPIARKGRQIPQHYGREHRRWQSESPTIAGLARVAAEKAGQNEKTTNDDRYLRVC